MKNNNINNEDINLKELFLTFWNRKLFILSFTIIAAVISITVSLLIPNKYESFTILVPSDEGDKLSSQLASYASLASLAGVRVPESNSSKSKEAMQKIKSFDFFTKHFLPYINLEDLLASKKWSSENNTLKYDSNKFDKISGKWNKKYTENELFPSNQKAYEMYQEILDITEDKKTFFVTVKITHFSPVIAKNWLEIIIKNINESMRLEEQQLAERSITYLKNSYESTNVQSLRDATSSLLESQIQRQMLSYTNKYFIFKPLEPPIVPEKKSSPSRALICIIGTIFGFILSLFIALFLRYKEDLYQN